MIRSAVAIFCLAAALLGLWAAIPEDPPPAAVDQVGEQEAEVVAEASVVEVVAAGDGQRVAAEPTQGSMEPGRPETEGADATPPGQATLPVSFENLEGEPFASGVIVVSRVPSAAEEAAVTEYDASIKYEEIDWSPEEDALRLTPGRYKLRGYAGLFEDPTSMSRSRPPWPAGSRPSTSSRGRIRGSRSSADLGVACK